MTTDLEMVEEQEMSEGKARKKGSLEEIPSAEMGGYLRHPAIQATQILNHWEAMSVMTVES